VDHNAGASAPGSVVLDIGPGCGALILYVTAAQLGEEIDVSPVGGGGRTHSAVRERLMPGGSVYCAVYPSLPAGDYTVWLPRPVAVSVDGGTVTELRR
jgi:hypothetical protein